MTCEVCIMNPHGIVLAADSATTVTEWVDGKFQERYFKGANKILLLSHHKPIALMTYGSADLQGLPWETITKDFANALGQKSFNNTFDYAGELFNFIANNIYFYDDDQRKNQFINHIRRVSFELILQILNSDVFKSASDVDEKISVCNKVLDDYDSRLEDTKLPSVFVDEDVAGALAAYSDFILEENTRTVAGAELEGIVDVQRICHLSVKSLYKYFDKYLEETGLVIVGFGDHEYLPSICEYKCYGFILSRLLYVENHRSAVTSDKPAYIKAFARSDMVDTFERGMGFDVFASVNNETKKCLTEFAREIKAKVGAQDIPDLEQLIDKYRKQHSDAWLDAAFDAHSRPLWRVISYLPVSDMAQLAETLVSLQSLKERVTAPSESVSGPIDVAVVTRGDGVVWIKRKHYFERELNPRYFMRISKIYD